MSFVSKPHTRRMTLFVLVAAGFLVSCASGQAADRAPSQAPPERGTSRSTTEKPVPDEDVDEKLEETTADDVSTTVSPAGTRLEFSRPQGRFVGASDSALWFQRHVTQDDSELLVRLDFNGQTSEFPLPTKYDRAHVTWDGTVWLERIGDGGKYTVLELSTKDGTARKVFSAKGAGPRFHFDGRHYVRDQSIYRAASPPKHLGDLPTLSEPRTRYVYGIHDGWLLTYEADSLTYLGAVSYDGILLWERRVSAGDGVVVRYDKGRRLAYYDHRERALVIVDAATGEETRRIAWKESYARPALLAVGSELWVQAGLSGGATTAYGSNGKSLREFELPDKIWRSESLSHGDFALIECRPREDIVVIRLPER